MTYTIAEIAAATGLTAVGDTSLRIARPTGPENAAAGDLVLAMSPDYEAVLRNSPARAAVLWEGADWQAQGNGTDGSGSPPPKVIPEGQPFSAASLSKGDLEAIKRQVKGSGSGG